MRKVFDHVFIILIEWKINSFKIRKSLDVYKIAEMKEIIFEIYPFKHWETKKTAFWGLAVQNQGVSIDTIALLRVLFLIYLGSQIHTGWQVLEPIGRPKWNRSSFLDIFSFYNPEALSVALVLFLVYLFVWSNFDFQIVICK